MENVNTTRTIFKPLKNRKLKDLLFHRFTDELKTLGVVELVLLILFLGCFFILSFFMKTLKAFSFASFLAYIICFIGVLVFSILIGTILVRQYFIQYCSLGFSRDKVYKTLVLKALIYIFIAYITWLTFLICANCSSIISVAESKDDIILLSALALHNKLGIFTVINMFLTLFSLGVISILVSVASQINKFIQYASIITFWFLYVGIFLVKQTRIIFQPLLKPFYDHINTPYVSIILILIIIASLECSSKLCKKISL